MKRDFVPAKIAWRFRNAPLSKEEKIGNSFDGCSHAIVRERSGKENATAKHRMKMAFSSIKANPCVFL